MTVSKQFHSIVCMYVISLYSLLYSEKCVFFDFCYWALVSVQNIVSIHVISCRTEFSCVSCYPTPRIFYFFWETWGQSLDPVLFSMGGFA